ncbi:MAG: nuclear transport factor 2 family protein [bacterium]
MTPEDFPKLFATAFAAQNTAALVEMLTADAEVVSLTGALAEDADEARQIFDREFAGTLAKARLVSGRTRLRPIGPGGAVQHQRFVVIGARDEAGKELPRFGAVLTAVLLARAEGWRAVSLCFSALV